MAIGVQEADVWQAADAILQTGDQPTIERVRLYLGRGSPNTVGPHLKAWFRSLGPRLGSGGGQTSPTPDNVAQAAQQFWDLALATAQAQWQETVAEERRALALAQDALATDRQSLQAEQKRLDQRETDLKAAIYSAREQAAAAQDRANTLAAQLQQSDTRADALSTEVARAAERERALQERLHETQARHREEFAVAQARHASHERRWLNDLDGQRQAVKKLQEELDHTRKAVQLRETAHQEALAQAAASQQLTEDALAVARDELSHSQRLLAEREQLSHALETQLALAHASAASLQQNLQERIAELNQRVAEQGAQLRIKDEQIGSQTQTITQLQAQLLAAVQTISATTKEADSGKKSSS